MASKRVQAAMREADRLVERGPEFLFRTGFQRIYESFQEVAENGTESDRDSLKEWWARFEERCMAASRQHFADALLNAQIAPYLRPGGSVSPGCPDELRRAYEAYQDRLASQRAVEEVMREAGGTPPIVPESSLDLLGREEDPGS